MFPPGNSTATAAPPLPPEIQAQQGQPSAAAMFQGIGAGIQNPLDLLKAQVAKLEQWAAETQPLVQNVNPAFSAYLVPIAQAGKALQQEIESLEQRMAGPSPTVAGTAPPNLPGNIPGGRPAI